MDNRARLIWDQSKSEETAQFYNKILEIERVAVNPVFANQGYFEPGVLNAEPDTLNHFHYGNNLELLESLVQDKVKIDLIYIDPPYMTELDYHSTISIGTYSATEHVNRPAFQDRWPQGLDSYLNMLYPRLKLMRQILSEHGSVFVHVDWHVSHYVRVLLDEIFGPENFINEIVWCFGGGSSSRRYFHRKHDLIFWYGRSVNHIYNAQFRPYTEGTVQRGLTNVKGDRYKLNDEGALMQDWWTDINKILSPTARENLKFPTQKPLSLIKRIVAAASHPGSTVADFFAGSGTMAQVCNELGRKWIVSDSSPLALQTSLYRLIKTGSTPFKITAAEKSGLECNGGELVLKKPTIISGENQDCLVNIGIESFLPSGQEGQCKLNFADYIEFWEVDADYKGDIFHSDYQIIRSQQRFREPLTIDLMIRLNPGHNRTIAVKVYDVWANQTMQVLPIGV